MTKTVSDTQIEVVRLARRPQFLFVRGGVSERRKAVVIQARRHAPEFAKPVIGEGFTATKKIGNAVARNRAKRRLREIARAVLPSEGQDGWDYVLIGRKSATATHDFQAMQADLSRALRKAHG